MHIDLGLRNIYAPGSRNIWWSLWSADWLCGKALQLGAVVLRQRPVQVAAVSAKQEWM